MPGGGATGHGDSKTGEQATTGEVNKDASFSIQVTPATPATDPEPGLTKTTRLVVPKNCHIPIKQHMVDIFHASRARGNTPSEAEAETNNKSQPSDPEPKSAVLDGKLGLDVESNNWAQPKPERSLKENHKEEAPVIKPTCMTPTEYLSPDAQMPPKKRGPKKVDTGEQNKSSEPKSTTSAPKTRKRGKGKPDEQSKLEGSEPAEEKGSPSERLREHLKDRKAARIASEAAEETVKKDKKGKRAAEGNSMPKSEKEKKNTESPHKQEKEPEEIKSKAAGKRKKETPETDEKSEDEVTKKAKLRSRKCVAYAKAKRETPGSLEEKTKAAKKVSRMQVLVMTFLCHRVLRHMLRPPDQVPVQGCHMTSWETPEHLYVATAGRAFSHGMRGHISFGVVCELVTRTWLCCRLKRANHC